MNAFSTFSRARLSDTLGENAVRALDWVSLVVWGLVALVGILQSKQYNGHFLTDYGGDVFGPVAFWWTLRRTIFASLTYGAEIAALTLLMGCFLWEFCQRFDLSDTVLFFTKGVFDPLDLLAYSLSLLCCYGVDKMLQFRERSRANEDSCPSVE